MERIKQLYCGKVNFGDKSYNINKQQDRQEIIKKYIDKHIPVDLKRIAESYVAMKQKYLRQSNPDNKSMAEFIEAVEVMLESNYDGLELVKEREATRFLGISFFMKPHNDIAYKASRYQEIMDHFTNLVSPQYFQIESEEKSIDINHGREFDITEFMDKSQEISVSANRMSTYIEPIDIQESTSLSVDFGLFPSINEHYIEDPIEEIYVEEKSVKTANTTTLSEYFIIGGLNRVSVNETVNTGYNKEILTQMTNLVLPFIDNSDFEAELDVSRQAYKNHEISKKEFQAIRKEIYNKKLERAYEVLGSEGILEKLTTMFVHLDDILSKAADKDFSALEIEGMIAAFNVMHRIMIPFGTQEGLFILINPQIVRGDSGRVFLNWEITSLDNRQLKSLDNTLRNQNYVVVLPNNNTKATDNIKHAFDIGQLFSKGSEETLVLIDYAGKGVNLSLNFGYDKPKLGISDQAESVLATVRAKSDKKISFYSHSFGGMVLSLTLKHIQEESINVDKIVANGFAKDKNSMVESRVGIIYRIFDGWLIGKNNINKFDLLAKYLKTHPETRAIIINHAQDPYLKEVAWLSPQEALNHPNLQMVVLKGGNKQQSDDYHLPIYSYNTVSDFDMEVEHFEAKIKPAKEKYNDDQGREWEEISLGSSIIVEVGEGELTAPEKTAYVAVIDTAQIFWNKPLK